MTYKDCKLTDIKIVLVTLSKLKFKHNFPNYNICSPRGKFGPQIYLIILFLILHILDKWPGILHSQHTILVFTAPHSLFW